MRLGRKSYNYYRISFTFFLHCCPFFSSFDSSTSPQTGNVRTKRFIDSNGICESFTTQFLCCAFTILLLFFLLFFFLFYNAGKIPVLIDISVEVRKEHFTKWKIRIQVFNWLNKKVINIFHFQFIRLINIMLINNISLININFYKAT